MPANVNSASRLYSLFSRVQGQADNTQVLSVWATTFALHDIAPRLQAIEVARRLDVVNREIQLVREGMARGAFSPKLYEGALSAFEDATSPVLLPQAWSGVRGYLSAENLVSLRFCSEILPDEESVISQEVLDEIVGIVGELRAAAGRQEINATLQALLIHHAELIERAIIEYPEAGVKALRKAAQAGLGELVEAKESLAKHGQSEEVTKLSRAWKRVGEVTDGAIKADKLLEVGRKAWNFLESILTTSGSS